MHAAAPVPARQQLHSVSRQGRMDHSLTYPETTSDGWDPKARPVHLGALFGIYFPIALCVEGVMAGVAQRHVAAGVQTVCGNRGGPSTGRTNKLVRVRVIVCPLTGVLLASTALKG